MESVSGTAAPSHQEDLDFQAGMLQQVSRTYALTIPRLPRGLREVVANAYLLCRIADTIEDDPALDARHMKALLLQFTEVVAGSADAEPFAAELSALLSAAATTEERALAASSARITRITHRFTPAQRRAVERCLEIMARGMVRFQQQGSGTGLPHMAEFDQYCYHVAGVVAEMLTELFCDYSPAVNKRREDLMRLAPSYGQGLQMTNILKDIWSDLEDGVCWLPQELFLARGFDPRELGAGGSGPGFDAGLDELFSIAHYHLRQGLEFILLIPAKESGIRRHLLLTLGMAAWTLRRTFLSKDFRAGKDFPLPKRAAPALVTAIDLLADSNLLLRGLFCVLLRQVPVRKSGGQPPVQPGEQQ